MIPAILIALLLCGSSVFGQPFATNVPVATKAASKFRSAEDGWLDASGFLDEKYGFLPVIVPITEPAVGYGAAAGLAFVSKPLGETRAGFDRPSITARSCGPP